MNCWNEDEDGTYVGRCCECDQYLYDHHNFEVVDGYYYCGACLESINEDALYIYG